MSIASSNFTWYNNSNNNQMVIDPTGTYVYINSVQEKTNFSGVYRVLISDPTQVQYMFQVYGGRGLAVDNTYIYVGNTNSTLTRVLISDPNQYDETFFTEFAPNFMVFDSTYTNLYVSEGSVLYKIPVANPSQKTFFLNNTQMNGRAVIDKTNTYMYIANSAFNYNQSVTRIPLNDPNSRINDWILLPGGGQPTGITFDNTGKYLLISNNMTGYISRYLLSNPTQFVEQWNPIGMGDPNGIALSNNILFVALNNYIGQIILEEPVRIACFNKDTKILTDNGYKLVQNLRKGDLIKTVRNGYKAIDMIGKKNLYNIASEERIKDQLYKYSPDKYPDLFEPLIITGCHSILVDRFTSDEQKEKTRALLGDIYVTDKKYRLPACIDSNSSVYNVVGDTTIYHLALENDDYYMNYGIYANGLLVETSSKRYLKEISGMKLLI